MPHPCQVLTEDTFVSVAVLKAPIQWDEQHEVQAIFLVSVSRQKNKKLQDFTPQRHGCCWMNSVLGS